jgi:hypothetical protein
VSHTTVLFVAYASVALLWLAFARVLPYWRQPERPTFAHPWREFAFAMGACVLVLLIGQLYMRGIRLPNRGGWRPLTESINQFAIFLPVVLLPILRRQPTNSVWLPGGNVLPRLGVGVLLAAIAFLIFLALEERAPPPGLATARLFSLNSVPIAVQVFLEDVTIALLFVRLAAALSLRWAVAATATLFALGHVPAMLADANAPAELGGLIRDVALGVMLLGVVWRSGDILWFWPVHSVMDLTQFMTRGT